LFAHRHCIACHTLPDSEKIDVENGRTPLMYLKAKFKPAALFAFLKNPSSITPGSVCPTSAQRPRSQRLTAFLLSRQQKSLDEIKGDSGNGKKLVQNAGCLNCHALPDKTPSNLKAPTWPISIVAAFPPIPPPRPISISLIRSAVHRVVHQNRPLLPPPRIPS